MRKELLESEKPHDVRLVYLALLNMFKHRGHFLNSSLQIEGENSSVGESYHTFVDTLNDSELEFPEHVSEEQLNEILRSNDSRKRKVEKLLAELNISKKQKRECQFINLISVSYTHLAPFITMHPGHSSCKHDHYLNTCDE